MVFANTEQTAPLRINGAIGKAKRFAGGEWFWFAVRILDVQTLIHKIGEVDDVIVHGIGAAAIFMHAAAHVEPGG